MINKFIPKLLFQLLSFAALIGIIGLTAFWGVTDTGVYPMIADRLTFVEDALQSMAAAVLTFFALFIPYFIIMMTLREFTHGMATMKDEIAYMKGEPQATFLDNPKQKNIGMGLIGLIAGVVFAVINLIIYIDSQNIYLSWCLAVPVSFLLGAYWLALGITVK